MSTLRSELEVMGPERVRRGMVAFEHQLGMRWDKNGRASCSQLDADCCCFVMHASDSDYLNAFPAVEAAFEYRRRGSGRADLYAECVAFLAEHGEAVESRVFAEVKGK